MAISVGRLIAIFSCQQAIGSWEITIRDPR
jgi:hypothetical protein